MARRIGGLLAYMMTVSSKGARAPSQPSCPDEPNGQPKKDNGNWPSASMTFDQFSYLADLDTDVVEQPEVDAIARYADLWLRSKVLNQPIRMKWLPCRIRSSAGLTSSGLPPCSISSAW